jgi:hypothetical protein
VKALEPVSALKKTNKHRTEALSEIASLTETARYDRSPDDVNFSSLQTLLVSPDLEFNALIFAQGLETLAMNFGKRNKQIVGAIIGDDKTKTLCIITIT